MARPFRDRPLTTILAVAALLRVAWIVACPNVPISDQHIYHVGAQTIANGLGFVDEQGRPHGWWPVGYSAALSPFYWLFGQQPISGYIANLVFGLLLVAGIYHLATELFGSRSATFAALAAAIYPTSVLLTTVMASENLYMLLAVWSTWALVRAVNQPAQSIGHCLLGGVFAGLSAYVRGPGILLIVVFPVLALMRRWAFTRATILSVVVGGVALVTLAPWGMRNYARFDHFSPVSMNSGSNLWMGNHPGSSGGYTPLPDDVEALGIVEREAVLRDRALTFIRENPSAYVALSLKRLWTTMRSDTIAAVWNETGIVQRFGVRALLPFKVLCSVAYYGLVALTIGALLRRRHAWNAYDLALASIVLVLCIPFVVIVGGNRYHLPLAPYLLVWAASRAQVGYTYAFVSTGRRPENSAPPASS